MNGRCRPSYAFGKHRLIPAERSLLRDGKPIALPPKAFDILVVLVENAGELVENKDMLSLVWPDSFVEEANIQVQISSLRKALNSDGSLIETVPKMGYRFAGDVTVEEKALNGNGFKLGEVADSHKKEESRSKPSPLLVFGIAFGVLILAGLWFFAGRSSRSDGFTGGWRLTKLTDSGSAFGAAISPDGKYAAYQSVVNGKYSLWIMDLHARTGIQIGPERDKQLRSLAFTSAEDALYYSADENSGRAAIYRVSRLGGEPKKVVGEVDSPFAFSPDGRKFVFVRKDTPSASMSLILSNLDANEQQVLATRSGSANFALNKRPSWSPDGKHIAVIGTNEGEKFQRVLSVSVADGQTQNVTIDKWVVLQDVVWEGDSDHIIFTAQDDIHFGPQQIWRTSISGQGKSEKITRELESYVGLSMSADAKSLVSTVSVGFNNLWLMPVDGNSPGQQILSNKGGGRVDTSWTPDERIVYTSNATGSPNIFVMRSDGTAPVQLTSDSVWKRSPVVSPDGRKILYVSSLNEPERIWIMNSDGTGQRQMNSTQVYRYPQFSPDGKSILFSTWNNEEAASYLWKISVEGGEPERLRGPDKFTPNLSPDMKMIAYAEKLGKSGATIKAINIDDGRGLRTLEVTENFDPESIRWSPDSKSILYRGSDRNFWSQPLDSREPRKLTDFNSDFPIYCNWTPEMKRLLCIRNVLVRDVVLFRSGG